MQQTVKTAHLFTNRLDYVDEPFSVQSATKTELINIPSHKLRHKICDKLQWSSRPHTCCSFELLDFSTTVPVGLWAKEKTNPNVPLLLTLCPQNLACGDETFNECNFKRDWALTYAW